MDIYDNIVYIINMIVLILSLFFRSKDKDGMDSYDRYWGIAGEGKVRGITGIIYDSNGSYDWSANLCDHNPIWN